MDLSAEKAWNAYDYLDEELEKLLPLVCTEARIGVDLFAGGRIHRVISGLAFLSPSPFCADWAKAYPTKKCTDFCRVSRIQETEAGKKHG